jgi:hypothetical protein
LHAGDHQMGNEPQGNRHVLGATLAHERAHVAADEKAAVTVVGRLVAPQPGEARRQKIA